MYIIRWGWGFTTIIMRQYWQIDYDGVCCIVVCRRRCPVRWINERNRKRSTAHLKTQRYGKTATTRLLLCDGVPFWSGVLRPTESWKPNPLSFTRSAFIDYVYVLLLFLFYLYTRKRGTRAPLAKWSVVGADRRNEKGRIIIVVGQ